MRFRLNYLTAVAGGLVGAVLTFLLILGAGQLYVLAHASRSDRTPIPGEGVNATYVLGISPFVLLVVLPNSGWHRRGRCPIYHGPAKRALGWLMNAALTWAWTDPPTLTNAMVDGVPGRFLNASESRWITSIHLKAGQEHGS